MNITQLLKSLPYLFKANVVPFIRGPYAQGKTGAIAQYAQENGYMLHVVNGGAIGDIGDLIGALMPSNEGYSKFMPPQGIYALNEWAKQNKDKYAILFIDEVTRSTIPGFFNACMPIAVERKVHGLHFEDNVRVVFADNPNGDDYDTLDFNTDKARSSRFCYINFQADIGEYLAFSRKDGNITSVDNFLTEHPDSIENVAGIADDVAKWAEKNRRGWSMVRSLALTGMEKEQPGLFITLARGCVGDEVGKYVEYLRTSAVSSIPLETVLDEEADMSLPLSLAKKTRTADNGLSIATAFLQGVLTSVATAPLTEAQSLHVRTITSLLPREALATAMTVARNVNDEHKERFCQVFMDEDWLIAYSKAAAKELGMDTTSNPIKDTVEEGSKDGKAQAPRTKKNTASKQQRA